MASALHAARLSTTTGPRLGTAEGVPDGCGGGKTTAAGNTANTSAAIDTDVKPRAVNFHTLAAVAAAAAHSPVPKGLPRNQQRQLGSLGDRRVETLRVLDKGRHTARVGQNSPTGDGDDATPPKHQPDGHVPSVRVASAARMSSPLSTTGIAGGSPATEAASVHLLSRKNGGPGMCAPIVLDAMGGTKPITRLDPQPAPDAAVEVLHQSDSDTMCPVCQQERRRLSVFYQSQVLVCVACKVRITPSPIPARWRGLTVHATRLTQDFFRRMVRKAREDESDANLGPAQLRSTDIAARFPRLLRCLDGGMDPLMVGVRRYTWRDPVRRALYSDSASKFSPKPTARSQKSRRRGSSSAAPRAVASAKPAPSARAHKRKAAPATASVLPPPSPNPGADDAHAAVATALLSAAGQMATNPAPAKSDASSVCTHGSHASSHHSVPAKTDRASMVARASTPLPEFAPHTPGRLELVQGPVSERHFNINASLAALGATCEAVLIRAGVLLPASTPRREGCTVVRCRVAGCTGRALVDSCDPAKELCEYHDVAACVPGAVCEAGVAGASSVPRGRVFSATILQPDGSGNTRRVFVQACNSLHGCEWKWLHEFPLVTQRSRHGRRVRASSQGRRSRVFTATACSLCSASIARAAAPLPRKLADTTIPPRPHHHHDHAVALLGRSTPMEGVDAAHPGSVPLTAHDGASVGSRASVSPALSMRRSTGSFSSEFSSVTDECSDASSHLVLEVDGCAIGGVEVTCMLRGRRVCNPLLQPSSC